MGKKRGRAGLGWWLLSGELAIFLVVINSRVPKTGGLPRRSVQRPRRRELTKPRRGDTFRSQL